MNQPTKTISATDFKQLAQGQALLGVEAPLFYAQPSPQESACDLNEILNWIFLLPWCIVPLQLK